MNLLVILYGIIGLILGFIIPELTHNVMIYKKGRNNINKNGFLYTLWFRIIMCIINCSIWVAVSIFMDKPIVGLLINLLIYLGIIIAFIDVYIRIIPNELVLAIFILGIIFQIISFGFKELFIAVVCMVVMMAVFTAVAGFMGFGSVGAGDVKLAGAIGLCLGYPLITFAIIIMAISLLSFILIGLGLKKIYLSTMLPLGPFISAGFIVSLILHSIILY